MIDLHPRGETNAKSCVGISGRICAGKTTAARHLEQQGFSYTRCSFVVDDEVVRRGERLNRESQQRIGAEIHKSKGQRWLCKRALERAPEGIAVVVDGLRFPEDHAFFAELFGTSFVHLHIQAAYETRARRYIAHEDDGVSFETADNEPVESEIDSLAKLAHAVVKNEGTIDEFTRSVSKEAADALKAGGGQCPSQLS